MPKIIYNKGGDGGKIVWDSEDWLGGLHPQYFTNGGVYRRLFNTLSFARSIDPYRVYGSLAPGYQPTNATNVSVVDAAISSVVVNGLIGYLSGGTKLHKLTISTATITNDAVFPHAVASSVMQDVVIYNVSGTLKLFYSWYDGTDGDVGIYDFSTDAFDDDFMSTVPTGAAVLGKGHTLPMIVGGDDLLYVGDGNLLKSYDGSTNTYNGTIMDFPNNFIITGFAKSNFSLVIFGYTSTSGTTYNLGGARAYFWDYLSETYDKIVELEDNFVQAPFNWKGTIGCFTQGRQADKTANKYSRIQLYDGEKFVQLAEFFGNVPINDGVDILGDMIQWNSQGIVYSFGNPFGLKVVLNKINEGFGSTSGILKSLGPGRQFISSGVTTSGGLQSLNSNYNIAYATLGVAEPEFNETFKGKMGRIRVKYNSTFTGGRAITLTIRGKSGDINVIIDEESTQTKTVKEYTQDISGNELKEFFDIYPEFVWLSGAGATVAPIVDKLEVYFTNKKISIT